MKQFGIMLIVMGGVIANLCARVQGLGNAMSYFRFCTGHQSGVWPRPIKLSEDS